MKHSIVTLMVVLGLPLLCSAQQRLNGRLVEGRAVWANPARVATSDSAVRAFVELCKRANIQLIVMLTKFSDQRVYYHSKKFPETIAPAFRDFDPLAAMVREAHKAGIRVHAWVSSFTESPDGPVMQKHPEWAARNPDGQVTSEAESLAGGRKYFITWMCPARRPGYTDQWLLPMIEEIVANYEVDGIHHDYVRYPGDVAPDGYCFGDYCLEEMLKYAHFYYEAFPDTVYPIARTLPNLVANWWSDPTVKPAGWDEWSRRRKADFFLRGSFIRGGPADLDYFFYTFRQDQIKRFVREAWERASAIRPDIEISAAVFKNPIASGRFIGQRWTDFAPWIDIMMPMVYRSHFPARPFSTFLTHLKEYTRYEYRWAKNRVHLYMGLDVNYIFNEERFFPINSLAVLDSLQTAPASSRPRLVQALRNEFASIKTHLEKVAPEMAANYARLLKTFDGRSAEARNQLRNLLMILRNDPPQDYYPGAKVRQIIETVRQAGANGIVLFEAGLITRYKLWPVLEQVFAEPAIPPEALGLYPEMSIGTLKSLRQQLATFRIQRNLAIAAALLLVFIGLVRYRRKS